MLPTQLAMLEMTEDGYRTGRPADFFQDYTVSLIPHSESTVLLIRSDTEEPNISEPACIHEA